MRDGDFIFGHDWVLYMEEMIVSGWRQNSICRNNFHGWIRRKCGTIQLGNSTMASVIDGVLEEIKVLFHRE